MLIVITPLQRARLRIGAGPVKIAVWGRSILDAESASPRRKKGRLKEAVTGLRKALEIREGAAYESDLGWRYWLLPFTSSAYWAGRRVDCHATISEGSHQRTGGPKPNIASSIVTSYDIAIGGAGSLRIAKKSPPAKYPV